MKKKDFLELKEQLEKFKTSLNNLITEQNPPPTTPPPQSDDEGLFSGDFNSEASKQSWSEFFYNFGMGGGGLAVALEIATWHGERDQILINNPAVPGSTLPVSNSWKIDYITSSNKVSDFTSNDKVKKDDVGEYYEFDTGSQILKFYLPNTAFFSELSANKVPWKFTTDNGTVYKLVLQLLSRTGLNSVLSGVDSQSESTNVQEKSDPVVISLKNGNPDEGNGWSFYTTDTLIPYFKEEGGSLIPMTERIIEKDLMSSFQLWWEKWGVVAQIIASLILLAFVPALGSFIIAAATRAFGAGSATVLFLEGTAIGGIGSTVTISELVAEFLLDGLVNFSAGMIDLFVMDNQYAATMSFLFMAFPPLIRLGKIGRFIEPYDDAMAQTLAKKIIGGVYENMGKRDFLKFLLNLTPKEKFIFAKGMAYLQKEGADKELKEAIESYVTQAVKNGKFPSKLRQWWESSGKTFGKTAGAAGLFWVVSTAMYVAIEKYKDSDDKRTDEEISEDASKNAEKIANICSEIDLDPNLGDVTSMEILSNITDGDISGDGPMIFYQLSKPGEPSDVVTKKIMDTKWAIAEDVIEEKKQFDAFFNAQNYPNTYNNLKLVNSKKTNPVSEKELNDLVINTELMNPSNIETLLGDSNFTMTNELSETITKHPCLKNNFDLVEGDYDIDPNGNLTYFLKFKCIKEITFETSQVWEKTLKVNDNLYLFENGDWWATPSTYQNKYTGFKCPE